MIEKQSILSVAAQRKSGHKQGDSENVLPQSDEKS